MNVIPVQGRSALRRFIGLPWALYEDDPTWVPPLRLERQHHLSPRNPYFAHAHGHFWMAYRGDRPVGRISAQVDDLHLQRYQDATGFFGLLEAENDAEVFRALTDVVEGWLRDQGMRRVLGPFNLSINQECGLLVEGFDTPPYFMMGHGRPYYAARLEEQGYGKVQDLLAYRLESRLTIPPSVRALVARAGERVRLRPLRKSQFARDLWVLRDIFEDAWSQNWGFLPFTEGEFKHLGQNLKFLVHEELIQIAEVDGVPAAMIVVLPNLNEVIRDLDGRLLPLGWLKLLWRLKVRHPKTARVALMGVRRCYQGSLLGAALAFMVIQAAYTPVIRLGIQQVELSWILENNTGMRHIIESLGGVAYKRYRIYGKSLI